MPNRTSFFTPPRFSRFLSLHFEPA